MNGRYQKPSGAASGTHPVLSIKVPISVKLGQKRMRLVDVLAMRPGQVLEFDRTTASPLELLSGRNVLAAGIVVQLGDRLGLSITAIRS